MDVRLAVASTRAVCLALCVAASFAAAPAELAAAGCAAHDRGGELLPWVGEWRALADDADGPERGRAEIRPILGGCAFAGVRHGVDGGEAHSLIYLDPATGDWRERWVSSDGDTGSFRLSVDGEVLAVDGAVHSADGTATAIRAEIVPRRGGGFVETLSISLDGGETFGPAETTVYLPLATAVADADYPLDRSAPAARAPEAPEAAPVDARPSPAPVSEPSSPPLPEMVPPPADEGSEEPVGTTAEAPPTGDETPEAAPADAAGEEVSSVRVRSKRKVDESASIAMESPMTLEVTLGPLHHLPPETGWPTTELAPYVADQVSVPRMLASRSRRRGKVSIELTLYLKTTAFQRTVDLAAVLLSGDTPVAETAAESIALGKLIGLHDREEGRPVTVAFELEEATFAGLFADDRRPSVRLTLTVD